MSMTLHPDDVIALDARARQIGLAIGWTLAFGEAPNPEYVFLTADTLDEQLEVTHLVVFGPKKIDEVTVHEVDLLLDDLESGRRRLMLDEDGDPRLL